MDNAPYHYSAFISYRHIEPDMTAAKKLHTLIETYRIPGAVKASGGKQKMGRVFRDQEELPLSSDLGGDIRKALEDSEWLVVICSPELLESKWCMTEIDTFIALGRRDHILTVLSRGAPEESIPPQLRFAEVNGERVEKEPLAANIVSDGVPGMLKRLKSEKLRLLAPMLGVTYDTLRQRARERRLKTTLAAATAALALVAAFSVYAVIQNQKIEAERNAALKSQSMYLADASDNVLADGDRMLAMLLALEALPKDFDDPERPLVDNAVTSLRNAVVSGVGDNQYTGVTEIDGEFDAYRANDEMLCVFSSVTPGYIAAYNLATGEDISDTLPYAVSHCPVSVWFDDNLSPFLFYDDCVKYLSFGTVAETALPAGGEWKAAMCRDSTYAYAFYTPKQGVFLKKMYFTGGLYKFEELNIVSAAPLGKSSENFLLGNYANDLADALVLQVKAGMSDDDGEVVCRYFITEEDLGETLPRYSDARIVDSSADGSAVLAADFNYVYIWNAATGELAHVLRSDEFSGSFWDAAFTPGDEPWFALRTEDCAVYICDYIDGRTVRKLDAGLAKLTTVQWNSDGTRLLCACEDNCARVFSAETGELLQKLEADWDVTEATYANTYVYGNAATDAHILLRNGSHIKIFALGAGVSGSLTAASPLSGISLGSFSHAAFSPDAATLWLTDRDTLWVFDAADGSLLKKIDDGSSRILPFGDRYILTWMSDTYACEDAYINIYDTGTLELVAQITPSYPHIFTGSNGETEDRETMFNIDNLTFSPDGSTLIFNAGDTSSNRVDSCVFAYDTETWQELWHFGIYDPADTAERVFPFAQDWPGIIRMDSEFTDGGETVLTRYRYSYGLTGYAVELRDARTGEVKSAYPIPDDASGVSISTKYGQLAYLDDSFLVHLLSLADAAPLATLQMETTCSFSWIDEHTLYMTPAPEEGQSADDPSRIGYLWNITDGTVDTVSHAEMEDQYIEAAVNDRRSRFGDTFADVATTTIDAYYAYDNNSSFSSVCLFPYADGWATYTEGSVVDVDMGKIYMRLGGEGDQVSIAAAAPDGSALLVRFGGYDGGTLVIERDVEPSVLAAAARDLLVGRTLTGEEEETYHILVTG